MSWISSQYPSPNVSPYCHDGILIGQHFVFFPRTKIPSDVTKTFFFLLRVSSSSFTKNRVCETTKCPNKFLKNYDGNHELKAMKEILLAGAPWL